MTEQDPNIYKGDAEKAKVFTVRQVLLMIFFTVSATFSAAGVLFRFNSVESRVGNLEVKEEVDMKNLEKKLMEEIHQMKREGEFAIELMREGISNVSQKVDDNYQKLNQRQDNIRDRQNARIENLEMKNSDSK